MPITTTRCALLAGGITAALLATRNRWAEHAEGARLLSTDPTPVEKMRRVLQALELFGEQVPDAKDVLGASEAEITEAERELGRALPDTMRQLYAAHDGSQRIISFWPLLSRRPDGLSVVCGSAHYREWQWPVPPELFLFGDDGSESAYGLWNPERYGDGAVVVELGEDSEPGCMAIVGDDLASFLLGQSAITYQIFMSDRPGSTQLLDILQVPQRLREIDPTHMGEDKEYYGLIQWANPGLPDPMPDPYARGMTAAEINDFVVSRGR